MIFGLLLFETVRTGESNLFMGDEKQVRLLFGEQTVLIGILGG
jgi:hypothetical protein